MGDLSVIIIEIARGELLEPAVAALDDIRFAVACDGSPLAVITGRVNLPLEFFVKAGFGCCPSSFANSLNGFLCRHLSSLSLPLAGGDGVS